MVGLWRGVARRQAVKAGRTPPSSWDLWSVSYLHVTRKVNIKLIATTSVKRLIKAIDHGSRYAVKGFGFFLGPRILLRDANLLTATQYELSPPPGDAVSSIAFAPAPSTKLLVASWDKKLYSYDASKPESSLLQTYEHKAPVLDVCFGDDENDAFTAGMDWVVNRYGTLG